ncbi:MAG: metal-dependent hydrolase [Anaerolineae bacterium]|nr:metal-dependent hydrolase [Anaerolineae bacterium]
MKGITHFITGVAIATFFPEVVQQAAGGSLLPMLGGIGGILPDTLDFKFARYFERYDLEIDPGPEPDARQIAEQVVGAMRRAYETGKSQNVMLHTIRLGGDLWRQYTIRFDPARNEVAVRIGPVVNTGQVPFLGSEPPPLSSPPLGGKEGGREARAKVGVPMVHTYDAENTIDIFSGPSFRFERKGDRLHVHFLDWHRRWSHSLTLAMALGLLGWLLFGKWGGLVIGLGFVGHIVEDQLGFMGSNLLYPLTKGRVIGAQLLRSGDAIPNFLTVWVAVMAILFNLDRFSARPMLDPWWFLGLAVALPVVVLGGLYQWQRWRGKRQAKESLQQRDIVSEAEEVEVG